MPGRPRALILLALAGCTMTAPEVTSSGAWLWESEDPGHGGYSAIEILPGGREGIVISDRNRFERIRITRDPEGRIAGVSSDGGTPLAFPEVLDPFDPEGLALAPDGTIFISVEQFANVLRYTAPREVPQILPRSEAFTRMDGNRSLEGLAIDADGALWTVSEGAESETLPTYVFSGGAWEDGPVLPRDAAFAAVGLDFDDRGRLYLLERDFAPPLGFRSRVRRFTLDGVRVMRVEEIMRSSVGTYDNLEGIAVWRDDAGRLRMTLVSDDNFLFLQKTELVEFDLPD